MTKKTKKHFLRKKRHTATGRAIGFALEQPLRVIVLACSASGILKQLECIRRKQIKPISHKYRSLSKLNTIYKIHRSLRSYHSI
ncbi:MAG: hypothetical protein LBJ00_18510 [Planctomycetaceae bacterium]|nr:hypothetical protein [Planctomycetaceae bacterium]